jgi:peptide subunit release factor RF-3
MEDLGIRDIIATVILEVEYEPKFSSASENSQQFNVLDTPGHGCDHDTQNDGNRKDDTTRIVSSLP